MDGAVGDHFLPVHIQIEVGGADVCIPFVVLRVVHDILHHVGQILRCLDLVPGNQHVAGSLFVHLLGHPDGCRFAVVGLALHLVKIPVGSGQGKVAYPDVGAVAFNLLHVPQGEGVVVPVGEQDCVRCAGIKVCLGDLAGKEAVGTVVVVPVLRPHYCRHRYADGSGKDGGSGGVDLLLQAVENGIYA